MLDSNTIYGNVIHKGGQVGVSQGAITSPLDKSPLFIIITTVLQNYDKPMSVYKRYVY